MATESQLPPITSTNKSTTHLDIPAVPEGRHEVSKGFLLPGPVNLPGVDAVRNPILGTMLQYTRYQTPKSSARIRTNYHKSVHQGSMFEDTGHRRSYYFIHPDWTSECSSARRLAATNRGSYSWDSRPSFQPLTDYVIPRLERRRGNEDKLNEALTSVRASASPQQRYPQERYDTHKNVRIQGGLYTQQRYPQERYAIYGLGSQTAREPLAKASLPAVPQKRSPSVMNGSHFYKDLLATELLAPKREATCPNLIKY